ncbi:NADH:ubiquinone oxidoreductase subunit 1 (chain H) [Thermoplasmatales archaeon BRNA1]|nr:NADH:ubiquinone oxidoreductase subunit 1 (chain H) [Thermoplasmatales archaeon BRNA1]
MVDYVSIRDWINFPDPLSNPNYPFGDVYNLPYDISYKLWEIIGGTLAWLINLIFPGNPVSDWLVCAGAMNFFALIVFMILMFLVPFTGCLVSLWEERKVLGRAMDRRGTMIGLMGFLQCVADGFKTFMKEDIKIKEGDKMGFMWTCSLIIGTSVLIAIMIPLSPRWFVVNYGSGLLIIMALYALAPFFILVSGWSQNNKYAMIGGIRATEMMVSYEVPLLIIIATVALQAGTFNIGGIVDAQYDTMPYMIPQFIGFITFFLCATAESERAPFDLAEAESELVEGWQTEYAGMKWGLIMLADYLRGYVSCAMLVIMFWGGWNLPFIGDYNTWIPEIVFLLKCWLAFFFMIIFRCATGRVRTDTILNLGWKVFMPLAILNLMVVLALKVGGVC